MKIYLLLMLISVIVGVSYFPEPSPSHSRPLRQRPSRLPANA